METSLLERLASTARKTASNSRKYIQRATLAAGLAITGCPEVVPTDVCSSRHHTQCAGYDKFRVYDNCGQQTDVVYCESDEICRNGECIPNPDPIEGDDNSDDNPTPEPENTGPRIILNGENWETNEHSLRITSSEKTLDYFQIQNRGLNQSLLISSERPNPDAPFRKLTAYIGLDENDRLEFYEDPAGNSIQINEYIDNRTLDVTFRNREGESARGVIELDTPLAKAYMGEARTEECEIVHFLNDINQTICKTSEAIGKVKLAGCVASWAVDFMLGGPTGEGLLGCISLEALVDGITAHFLCKASDRVTQRCDDVVQRNISEPLPNVIYLSPEHPPITPPIDEGSEDPFCDRATGPYDNYQEVIGSPDNRPANIGAPGEVGYFTLSCEFDNRISDGPGPDLRIHGLERIYQGEPSVNITLDGTLSRTLSNYELIDKIVSGTVSNGVVDIDLADYFSNLNNAHYSLDVNFDIFEETNGQTCHHGICFANYANAFVDAVEVLNGPN